MKFVHGKVSDYKEYKNWITGSFLPKNTPNYDSNLEIKVDYFENTKSFKKHYHSYRKTWTIVIEGCMHMLIDDNKIDIRKGEFIIYNPHVTEELLSTDIGTVAISIHTPSGEDDKIFV